MNMIRADNNCIESFLLFFQAFILNNAHIVNDALNLESRGENWPIPINVVKNVAEYLLDCYNREFPCHDRSYDLSNAKAFIEILVRKFKNEKVCSGYCILAISYINSWVAPSYKEIWKNRL